MLVRDGHRVGEVVHERAVGEAVVQRAGGETLRPENRAQRRVRDAAKQSAALENHGEQRTGWVRTELLLGFVREVPERRGSRRVQRCARRRC